MNLWPVKIGPAVVLALAGLSTAVAQEAELPPIIVTGTFELRQGPSVTDLFTQHLEKQIETKRAVEETIAKSPWYYSRYWSYIPLGLGSSLPDPEQFFKPQYLSLENQKQDWELRKSEKQSLFDRR
ncbi:MAG: hypothetical protein ABR611_08565 [Chthoniobacterales bacterium]